MTDTTLTPGRLWKQMTPDQRLRAARAFWTDEQAVDDQIQAALLIAERKKFRTKTVVSLDVERKARHLASLPTLPDALAARALIVYHLAEQRPMMGAFLDALGIAHENGLIQEDDVKPDASKMNAAAVTLGQNFPGRRRVALLRHPSLPGPGHMGRARRGPPEHNPRVAVERIASSARLQPSEPDVARGFSRANQV